MKNWRHDYTGDCTGFTVAKNSPPFFHGNIVFAMCTCETRRSASVVSIPASLSIVRPSMILQLQSERSPLGTHEHNPEIARHRGGDMPRTLTPYYRRASGCDRQEDIGALLCALDAAAAKVPGRKEWPAKLYTDRKSRGIIPARPVALERIARDSIAAPAAIISGTGHGSMRERSFIRPLPRP